jgi:catechol 2,3-dioxygenase-like lactoylglutathione lyase family enzyme
VSNAQIGNEARTVDMKLEVVVIPVSDVDRAKQFYLELGWKLDVDIAKDDQFRVVHFTPPGSQSSILFGNGVTTQEPGSAQGLHLIVSDIDAARAAPHPTRGSYGSFASFSDPDGNGWVFQEVTTRLPGRVDAQTTNFTSSIELAGALRRAAAAHGEHEKLTGQHDENWPDWYADYVVAEQAGTRLPT